MEERLHFLNSEIVDIERSVDSGESKEDVNEVLKQLMEYRARISGVNSRRARPLQVRENGREDDRKEEDTEEATEKAAEKDEQAVQQPDASQDTHILTLEERLRALEKNVGTDGVGLSADVSFLCDSHVIKLISLNRQATDSLHLLSVPSENWSTKCHC